MQKTKHIQILENIQHERRSSLDGSKAGRHPKLFIVEPPKKNSCLDSVMALFCCRRSSQAVTYVVDFPTDNNANQL